MATKPNPFAKGAPAGKGTKPGKGAPPAPPFGKKSGGMAAPFKKK